MNSYNLSPEEALLFWKQLHAEVERQGGNVHDCWRLLLDQGARKVMAESYLNSSLRDFVVDVPQPTSSLLREIDACSFDKQTNCFVTAVVALPKIGKTFLRLHPIPDSTDFSGLETIIAGLGNATKPGNIWHFLALYREYRQAIEKRARIIVPGTRLDITSKYEGVPLFEYNGEKTSFGLHALSDKIPAGTHALVVCA